MSAQKRLVWIDIIRCVAILGVIMCHVVVGEIYEFNTAYMQSLDIGSKLFAFTMLTLGRLGVPFFLLMSGYLLLDRQYDDEAYMSFFRNKWMGLFICVEFWIVVYHVFASIFFQTDILFLPLLQKMLFIKPSDMCHMWYMPMILGMYLFLPVMANGLKSVRLQTLKIPCLIVVLCTFVLNALNGICASDIAFELQQ